MDLDTERRRQPLYDVPDRHHGFLTEGGALIAGQVHFVRLSG
jgi:hypothetical protein